MHCQFVSVPWEGWSENDDLVFTTVLRSEHGILKIDKLVFLCLDLTYVFCSKPHVFLILAPLGLGVWSNPDLDVLFECHGICVQTN